jgi:hypothetical protein
MTVSFFKNFWSVKSPHNVHIDSILGGIYNGNWIDQIEQIRSTKDKEERDKLKKNILPAATFSGTFSERSEKFIESYSGIVVIDIDGISLKQADNFKLRLSKSKRCFCCFISPSGGLKALFKVNTPLEYHKKFAFPYISSIVEGMTTKVDPSGKDLSRLCFMSYDPDMHYNEDAIISEIPVEAMNRRLEEQKRRNLERAQKLMESQKVSYDANHIFDTCVKWTASKMHYHKGNRNNYVFYLACNLNRAGLMKEIAIPMIMANYSSMDQREIEQTVNSAYKHHSNEFGANPIRERRSSNNMKIKF